MHTLRNRILFFGSALAAGFAALGLQRYMLANCFDAKGLLIPGNLPMKLLWVVAIGFVLFLGALLTTIGGEGSYEDNFPRCTLSGLLMIAAGAVLACSVPHLGLDQQTQMMITVTPWANAVYNLVEATLKLLPWLAASSMAVLGICRMTGKKPSFFFGGIVCLFYMMMLVTNYRIWSADPKFHEYAPLILAGVLLMLSSFHRTSCSGGIIQRKKLLFTGLTAAVCSIASLASGFLTGFYLSGALWALGSMCNVAVLPPDPEEEEENEAPESSAE